MYYVKASVAESPRTVIPVAALINSFPLRFITAEINIRQAVTAVERAGADAGDAGRSDDQSAVGSVFHGFGPAWGGGETQKGLFRIRPHGLRTPAHRGQSSGL